MRVTTTKIPKCPICGETIAKVERNAQAYVTERYMGLWGGPPDEVQVKNADRTGVVTHTDGTKCLVANVDPLLGEG